VLYDAFLAGKSSPLPELSIQYADYARWQRLWLNHDQLERQFAYWRQQLGGTLPVLHWPTDRPRPAVQTFRGAITSFTLGRHLTERLKAFSRTEALTLFTTLLGAFAIVIHCYTGIQDLIIGTPSPAGRKQQEVQPLLGYFLNPVPLRVNFEGDPSSREFLQRAKRVIAAAISHDEPPVEALANALKLKPDPSRNPFFTIAVSLQPESPHETEEWDVTSMDADNGGAALDLYLAFIDGVRGIIGRIQYNPDVFATTRIDALIRDLRFAMNAFIARPAMRMSGLSRATQWHSH
jgi:non-ribosomal peptide synthetase component F